MKLNEKCIYIFTFKIKQVNGFFLTYLYVYILGSCEEENLKCIVKHVGHSQMGTKLAGEV